MLNSNEILNILNYGNIELFDKRQSDEDLYPVLKNNLYMALELLNRHHNEFYNETMDDFSNNVENHLQCNRISKRQFIMYTSVLEYLGESDFRHAYHQLMDCIANYDKWKSGYSDISVNEYLMYVGLITYLISQL